jgi:membrane-associated phospholipid phosphatase
MAFLTRWDEDHSRPTFGSALKDAFLRAVLPGILLFGLIVGIGLLLMGPFHSFAQSENSVNRWFEDRRTETWNGITHWMSTIGNTEYIIAVGVLVALIVWWRTKEWWFAVVPLLAISLQATWFVVAAAIVGRERPEVKMLDPAPPTSSYPSGHVGASSALYFTFAMMATRIENVVVRRLLVTVCVIVPFVVTYARLYRGAHHVTDVVVGMLNGLVCALLAWNYLRRSPAGSTEREGRTAERASA